MKVEKKFNQTWKNIWTFKTKFREGSLDCTHKAASSGNFFLHKYVEMAITNPPPPVCVFWNCALHKVRSQKSKK